jgi:hypothetical protein
MAKLSSRSSRAPPPARLTEVESVGPSGAEESTVGPNDPRTPPPRDHRLRPVLCNEDRLSDSASSLSTTSLVLSDDDNDDDGPLPGLDESETESDEDWEDEPEGDPNRGQNLRFRLQAAAAGTPSASATLRKFPWLTVKNLARKGPGEADLDDICAFNLHITHGGTNKAYERLRHSFPHKLNLRSLYQTQKRIAALSGVEPNTVDRCHKGCCCFTGKFKDLDACPYCNLPRFSSPGVPRKKFQYLRVKPLLDAMFRDKSVAKLMGYRHQYAMDQRNDDIIGDVFDGSIYKNLCDQNVVVDGQKLQHKYFSDCRDVALGLSLDGCTIFNRRKSSAWPVILINFNLPPKIRTRLRWLLCYAVIPAPSMIKNLDSYLIPLYEELAELAKGKSTLDPWAEEFFWLHVYLILAFGDYPALTKLMHMKGHNGVCPCRFCEIHGLRPPGANVYYVPLVRPDGSVSPADLPMRSHVMFIKQANQVLAAETINEAGELAKEYGIKGLSVLSGLGSLNFPLSFPFDFMHLIFENLIPNLVRHYTGTFKNLDCGIEDYQIPQDEWSEVCAIGEASGDTIPAAFGARVPNLEEDRSSMTAEKWALWAMWIAPIVLRDRFSDQKYYDHFTKLVRLVNKCVGWVLRRSELEEIRVGFQEWVEEYEE